MRRLLLCLPFALLPLAVAHAHEEHEHGSLGKHEHGVANLNLALEGSTLEIGLESPAMNIFGFEHAANSEADNKAIAAARTQLENPVQLFRLPAAAGCSLSTQQLHSPLLEQHGHQHDEHSDIDADYSFSCKQPEQLQQLDLSGLYQAFPAMHQINVQLIGPKGQQGVESTAANPLLNF